MNYAKSSKDFKSSVIYGSGCRRAEHPEQHDAVGKIILREVIQDATKQLISLPSLCNGIYNYKLILKDNSYTGKLNILQHE